ncbi:MAG: response regulator, partial [Elusimicrobia bacterium]|nr:response regulator [Elusimicrobiota bacterium]
QDYLEMMGGHKVSIADSGPDALSQVKAQKPDLIILDHIMPGITGVQVLGELKKSRETADIPVVIFSVSDEPTLEERKSLGVIEFLRKPIDFAKLSQIIQDLEKQKN